MKTLFLSLLALAAFNFQTQAQTSPTQFKVITVIESIIPGGIGRSRIIENTSERDAEALTTERNEGTDSDQRKVKRRNIKVDQLKETKLLNFYSVTGINFQNVASNDAIITSKLNQMAAEGWELFHVSSGVESDAGGDDGQGIFITRFIFKK